MANHKALSTWTVLQRSCVELLLKSLVFIIFQRLLVGQHPSCACWLWECSSCARFRVIYIALLSMSQSGLHYSSAHALNMAAQLLFTWRYRSFSLLYYSTVAFSYSSKTLFKCKYQFMALVTLALNKWISTLIL